MRPPRIRIRTLMVNVAAVGSLSAAIATLIRASKRAVLHVEIVNATDSDIQRIVSKVRKFRMREGVYPLRALENATVRPGETYTIDLDGYSWHLRQTALETGIELDRGQHAMGVANVPIAAGHFSRVRCRGARVADGVIVEVHADASPVMIAPAEYSDMLIELAVLSALLSVACVIGWGRKRNEWPSGSRPTQHARKPTNYHTAALTKGCRVATLQSWT